MWSHVFFGTRCIFSVSVRRWDSISLSPITESVTESNTRHDRLASRFLRITTTPPFGKYTRLNCCRETEANECVNRKLNSDLSTANQSCYSFYHYNYHCIYIVLRVYDPCNISVINHITVFRFDLNTITFKNV